jgi:tRNA(Ile)-lysidine synthase
MAARELRYAFFEQLAEEFGAQAIAVGHHRDDNVETLLLNIVRGTGIRGVRGIQPRNGKIIRPLLCLSHEDITSHLERNGMEYVTDSSNKLDVYSRNKIRLNVMPILSTVNFAASENIAMTIDNLSEACKIYENAVKESISKCLTVVGNTQVVDINTLLCEVSPRSILHEILSPLGFTNAQVFDILRAAEGGEPGRMFGAKQWRLLIDRGQIIIAPQPDESADIEYKFRFASHSGCMRFDGFGLIRYNIVDNVNLEFKTDKNFAYFDVDKMHGPLTIRTVQQGDSFTPFGLKGTKLLSDFMTDIKLNRFEKENQKVMCDANQIAWVIGKRSSDIFRVDEATKKVLILEFVRA